MKLISTALLCLLGVSSWSHAADQFYYDVLQTPVGAVKDIPFINSTLSQGSLDSSAMSFPLSIVNMPVKASFEPKLQQLNTLNYLVDSAFNEHDVLEGYLSPQDVSVKDTVANMDVSLALTPLKGLSLGITGRNLYRQTLSGIDINGVVTQFTQAPEYIATMSYDAADFSVSSELNLNAVRQFSVGQESALALTQYWQLGGELRTNEWLAVKLGYRRDLKNSRFDVYSLGTGFTLSDALKLDLTGVYGGNDAIGAVIQTSYHF